MIEFVLAVYMGGTLINQTQRFEDMDRCLYFAEKLSKQRPVPIGNGETRKIIAVCKPVNK